MPYKHFTIEKRNKLAALLRAKVKKKNIAKQLNKSRITIWREQKRGAGSNGRYYARKSKRLAEEKRIGANQRFRKIENNKTLRRYIVKKLRKYWSPKQIAGRWNKRHKRKHIGKDDNGSAFSEHDTTEKRTGMTIYFAFPYHSWERGTNENANGLLRQFFPKKINFATITQKDIQKAVGLLNNRPRKRLNYFTPYEIFNQREKCFTLE